MLSDSTFRTSARPPEGLPPVRDLCLQVLFLLVLLPLLAGCGPPKEFETRVVRVIDGDTIEITGGIRVRYIGIDTPETYPEVEYYGPEASAKNAELVQGRVVTLRKDVDNADRYGRLLRYVYVDDLFVNAELVRLGYAEAYPYSPNTMHEDLFTRLEDQARKAEVGMWAD